MNEEKPRLTADQCLTFAHECECDAEREQDPEDKARLLNIASVVRDLAAVLRKASPRTAVKKARSGASG